MSDSKAKAPPRLLFGAAALTAAVGMDGDFHLDTSGKAVHQRESGAWRLVRTLDGGALLTGAAAPAAVGNDGDIYVDSSTGAIHRKVAGAWMDTGDNALRPPSPERPQWRHLVEGPGGTIEPTRLQMLVFTVVTAFFVLLTVASSSKIPEIPESYLTLMGISNGIYLASKFAR